MWWETKADDADDDYAAADDKLSKESDEADRRQFQDILEKERQSIWRADLSQAPWQELEQGHHKTLSLKIPNIEFDVGYSTLGFTT